YAPVIANQALDQIQLGALHYYPLTGGRTADNHLQLAGITGRLPQFGQASFKFGHGQVSVRCGVHRILMCVISCQPVFRSGSAKWRSLFGGNNTAWNLIAKRGVRSHPTGRVYLSTKMTELPSALYTQKKKCRS